MTHRLRLLLFAVMAILFVQEAYAQLYNTEVLFFVDKESSLTNPQTYVRIYQFRNGDNYWFTGCLEDKTLRIVSNNLKKDNDYYEKQSWGHANEGRDMYNADMSNSRWIVYSASYRYLPTTEWGEGWPAHTSYYAFKKDLSEYMLWHEPDYDGQGRVVCRRLTKTELKNLRFTAARDFLK